MTARPWTRAVTAVVRLGRLGHQPEDSLEVRQKKGLLTHISLFYCMAGAGGASLYYLLGQAVAAALALGSVIVIAANLCLFFVSKRYALFRFVNLLLSLCLPFLLQAVLGGYAPSGTVMIWAVMAPLGAMIFHGARKSVPWFVAYVLLSVLWALLDTSFAETATALPPAFVLGLFAGNILAVSLIAYLMVQYFLREDEQAYAAYLDGLDELRVEADQRREAEEARETIRHQAAKLREMDRAKTQFFANVTHEFRTPITLILAPLEGMLEQVGLAPMQYARLRSMRRSALRLLHLVNDLLDLGRIDATQMTVSREPVDVLELVLQLVEETKPLAKKRGVRVVAEVPDDAVWYALDRKQLEKVLLNLFSNALKFTLSGGGISAVVQSDEHGLQLEVRDTGIGIPKHAHERIFAPFKQADGSTTRRFGGTGIGLSLASELTALMGGSISVESVEGEGSSFRLHFPPELAVAPEARTREVQDDARDPTPLEREMAFVSFAGEELEQEVKQWGDSGPRVLLAEDEGELRREIAEILAVEYRVTAVPDGEQALRHALLHKPDVIISDVMMPGLDGIELCTALRERKRFKDVPMVLLSARGDLEDRIRGREAGADSYLTKPFHPRELRATIDGLLRSRMRLIGSYIVEDSLGEGGQGEVLLARHRTSSEKVAIKIVSLSGSDEKSATDRLEREQEILAKLSHPNIVRTLERGALDKKYYVAMEYLQGTSLSEVRRRHGALLPSIVANIGWAICDALAAVHESGIVHGDIKGGNIMLLHDGESLRRRVRLIDFGAALARRGPVDKKMIGTVAYFAPELIGSWRPTVSTDIYALGTTLFVMASGTHPFVGRDFDDTIAKILGSARPQVQQFNEHIPDILSGIIDRAMNPDPEERWSTAAELRQALSETIEQENWTDPRFNTAVANNLRTATTRGVAQ